MFTNNIQVMLYVDDVAAERDFWRAIGFRILSEGEVMGYPTFSMAPGAPAADDVPAGDDAPAADSSVTFVVHALDFVREYSPEVVGMRPSILFEATDLEGLHARVAAATSSVSDIVEQPFPSFSFQSPSGLSFAVAAAR